MKLFTAMALIALSTTTPIFANDGRTPAQEAVCDELVGATPGLYGLCVAYCEAQDGTVDIDPTNLEHTDLSTPNRRILLNYEKKMKAGDPQMPCVNYGSSCPAWSADELADIGTHGFNIKLDYENDSAQVYFDREYNTATGENAMALIYISNGKYIGLYDHRTQVDPENNLSSIRTMELTEEEFNACKQELKNHVTNQ